jgi:hypothetical protein
MNPKTSSCLIRCKKVCQKNKLFERNYIIWLAIAGINIWNPLPLIFNMGFSNRPVAHPGNFQKSFKTLVIIEIGGPEAYLILSESVSLKVIYKK